MTVLATAMKGGDAGTSVFPGRGEVPPLAAGVSPALMSWMVLEQLRLTRRVVNASGAVVGVIWITPALQAVTGHYILIVI